MLNKSRNELAVKLLKAFNILGIILLSAGKVHASNDLNQVYVNDNMLNVINNYKSVLTIRDVLKPVDCLALNTYHESRGEPDRGIYATIGVVYTRVESNKFPDNICDVVFQKNQFSWVYDKHPDDIENKERYNHIRKIVLKSLNNRKVYQAITNYSDFYATNASNVYWKKIFTKQIVIGNHSYYKDLT